MIDKHCHSNEERKITQLDPAKLWEQLSRAADLRSSMDQILWAIFGTFWAANAILLVALFTTGAPPSKPWVGVIVSGVGAGLSLVWIKIQARALGHIERYEILMKRLETKLEVPADLCVSASLNCDDYNACLPKTIKARVLMKKTGLITVLFWFLGFVYFVLETGLLPKS